MADVISSSGKLKNIIYLTETQYETLLSDGSLTVGETIFTYSPTDTLYITAGSGSVILYDVSGENTDGAMTQAATTSLVSDLNDSVVHLSGAETITGTKAFSSTYPHIVGNGTGLYLSNDTGWSSSTGNYCLEASSFRPSASRAGEISIGTSSHTWKDLFLAGNANVGESVEIANHWTLTVDSSGNLVFSYSA